MRDLVRARWLGEMYQRQHQGLRHGAVDPSHNCDCAAPGGQTDHVTGLRTQSTQCLGVQ